MSKLLRAGLARYVKNPLFAIVAVVSFGVGLLSGMDAAENGIVDDVYFMTLFLGFAAFIALLLGREHGEGGFRSKVIVGFSKGQIFFSEWLLQTGFGSAMTLLFFLGIAITGHPVFKLIPGEMLFKIALGLLFASVTVATLLTVVGTLIVHRAVSAVLSILLVLGLMGASYELDHLLSQPAVYTIYSENEAGTFDTLQEINPRYVGGTARQILTQVTYALPFGQLEYYVYFLQPSAYEAEVEDAEESEYFAGIRARHEEAKVRMAWFPAYSLALSVLAGGAGYAVFRRRDLK